MIVAYNVPVVPLTPDTSQGDTQDDSHLSEAPKDDRNGNFRDQLEECYRKLQQLECEISESRHNESKLEQRLKVLEAQLKTKSAALDKQEDSKSKDTVSLIQTDAKPTTSKSSMELADAFIIDPESGKPVACSMLVYFVASEQRKMMDNFRVWHIEMDYVLKVFRANLEARGCEVPRSAFLCRYDTMEPILSNSNFGNSIVEMYERNSKGQMAWCLCTKAQRQAFLNDTQRPRLGRLAVD
ncbi:uncharacterized protein K452DRAFT_332118 [Aplosporella prunicola CBS 121167]|uniref:Uncharacterized protein n=1 Tax=Aplosporella prunicola CBS 121167 TaxID=1176127 RepID=A0A6A6BG71_9PEZI|nr:uncharacterized protein K452DRAFT_332118 [Aplosporella prunicola CBS 121167]KAF2142403.1 hypothetical protein K452DRAFT_332118 [Aplosporella prunicola CBS 121167]